jgi:hypothetical protein
MEPQYMILGHAAGVAAHLAIMHRQNAQDADTKELTRLLVAQGAIIEYVPSIQQPALRLFASNRRSGAARGWRGRSSSGMMLWLTLRRSP